MMMVRTLCSAILMAIFLAGGSLACTIAPERMFYRHGAAIEDTEWIALVRALPGEAGRDARLQVLEYLKGRGARTLRLGEIGTQNRFNPDSVSPVAANFYGHAADEFWHSSTFHVGFGTDCRAAPMFMPGNLYLVFGPHEYGIGFENVTLVDDRWVEFVRERVAQERYDEVTLALDAHLSDAAAVMRVQARWTDGGLVTRETILSGARSAIHPRAWALARDYLERELGLACYRRRLAVGHEFDALIVFDDLPPDFDPEIEPGRCGTASAADLEVPDHEARRDRGAREQAIRLRRDLWIDIYYLDACDVFPDQRSYGVLADSDGSPIEVPIPASRFGITDC